MTHHLRNNATSAPPSLALVNQTHSINNSRRVKTHSHST